MCDPFDPAEPVTYLNMRGISFEDAIESVRVTGLVNMGNREGIAQILEFIGHDEHAQRVQKMSYLEWFKWLANWK